MARIAKEIDMVGRTSGRLTVLSRAEDRISITNGWTVTRRYWNCVCSCGNTKEVRQDALLSQKPKSCGCITREVARENIKKTLASPNWGKGRTPDDLTGQRFGRLTVASLAEPYISPKGRVVNRWFCTCSCGSSSVVIGNSLKMGKATTCGCVPSTYAYSNLNTAAEVFIDKATTVHKGRYTYDKVVYEHSKINVIVTCKEHGDFTTLPSNHVFGTGCGSCFAEEHARTQHYNFLEKCRINPEFAEKEGYLYVIRLTAKGESFIKVGVSTLPEKRFVSIRSDGYESEVIRLEKMTNHESGVLERKILRLIKQDGHSYTPNIKFVGYTECSSEEYLWRILEIVDDHAAR